MEEWQTYENDQRMNKVGIVGKRNGKMSSALHVKLGNFIMRFLNKSSVHRSELSLLFVVRLEEVYLKGKRV